MLLIDPVLDPEASICEDACGIPQYWVAFFFFDRPAGCSLLFPLPVTMHTHAHRWENIYCLGNV